MVLFGRSIGVPVRDCRRGPRKKDKCHVRHACELSCSGHILGSLEWRDRPPRGSPGQPGDAAEAKITESGAPRVSPCDQGEGTLITGH